jgi:hypothetical protein
MNKFKIVMTVFPDPEEKTSADSVFSTVGRKFAGQIEGGPYLEGTIVRAGIDHDNQVNLYIEGEL